MLTLKQHILLEKIEDFNSVDADFKQMQKEKIYSTNRNISLFLSGFSLAWLFQMIKNKEEYLSPAGFTLFGAALYAVIAGGAAIEHYFKNRSKYEKKERTYRRIKDAADIFSKMTPKQRQDFMTYAWLKNRDDRIPSHKRNPELDRAVSKLGPEAITLLQYYLMGSKKFITHVNKLKKTDPELVNKFLILIANYEKIDLKSTVHQEEIANSVGGGGVSGILPTEDSLVGAKVMLRRKKKIDGDKIFNPDEVCRNHPYDEIKENSIIKFSDYFN